MGADSPDAPGAAGGTSGAPGGASNEQLASVLGAGVQLVAACRRVGTALLALVAAEARLARASVVLVLLGGVAFVALVASLWACVVALLAWALAQATGSIGVALGILVALHAIACVLLALDLRRRVRHASFPGTRAELRALGQQLGRDVERFRHAPTTPPGEGDAP